MSFKLTHTPALLIGLLAAPLAEAHPLAAHAAEWQAFIHPFLGLDHVLAMLVVGAWAALTTSARRLLPPLGFVGGLMAGAALGAGGVPLPAVETGIALSVVLLGPLAAREARLPALACLLVSAVAGIFHGHAHGSELAGLGWAYAWFVLGSVLLHAAGFAIATRINDGRHARVLRGALSASGVLGLALVWMG